MIAVSGPLTKIASYFQELPKTYRAEIRFGSTTDTLDRDGVIVAAEAPLPAPAALADHIAAMRGPQTQVPPQYSAIKVDGARAYSRARRGEQSELAARPIVIHSFALCDYRPPLATVETTVSKGTYIRAIARDLALRCGTIGYVHELRRTKIGAIDVADAHAPDAFRADYLLPPEQIAALNPRCKTIIVPDEYRRRIQNGEPPQRIDFFRSPRLDIAADQCALLVDNSGALLALCAYDGGSDDHQNTKNGDYARRESERGHGRQESERGHGRRLMYLHVCPAE